MTDAAKNRAVAEACGYNINEMYQVFALLPNGKTRYLGSVREPEVDDYGEVPDGLDRFDPLHNPAQAIEALDRKFEEWICERDGDGFWIAGASAEGDLVGEGQTFCAAGVAAILESLED